MDSYQLIYPMFAMVILTFSVLIRLFRVRSKMVADGAISASYFKTYQGQDEPELSAKLARHFSNLYEAPVLFYVCCLAVIATNMTTLPLIILAWAYVTARFIHTFIHTGGNQIWPRVFAYFSSWLILLSMWILLILRVGSTT